MLNPYDDDYIASSMPNLAQENTTEEHNEESISLPLTSVTSTEIFQEEPPVVIIEEPSSASKAVLATPKSNTLDQGVTWRKYNPNMLQKSISAVLPQATGAKVASRRRPSPQVRALTSSLVAGEYNVLLEKRTAITNLTETLLLNEVESQKKQLELKQKALELDVKIKEAQLKALIGDTTKN